MKKDIFQKSIKSYKNKVTRKGYFRDGVSLFRAHCRESGWILQKVYKKRKITVEKTVKVAIPILKKIWYTKCCFKRELNDKR